MEWTGGGRWSRGYCEVLTASDGGALELRRNLMKKWVVRRGKYQAMASPLADGSANT